MPKANDSELVTVRVPVNVLDALRLACQATGRSMSSEIRQGIQMRVDELREDPEVRRQVQERITQMQSLYGRVGDSTDEANAEQTPSEQSEAAGRP